MATLTGISIQASGPTKPSQRDIAECPWKYRGYKDFTSFIAADPDFFAVRRFDKLHVRSILTLQDHLAELEEKLDAIDEQFSLKTTKIAGSGPPTVINCVSSGTNSNPAADATQAQQLPDVRDINNGTIRDDMPERAKLVSEVLAKLTEYDRLLLDHCILKNMPRAPERNIRNIKSWFATNHGAIMEKETRFIDVQDDLVSGCKEKTRLRQLFEDQVILRTHSFIGLFSKRPPPSMSPQDRDEVYHFSDQAVDVFESVAVFVAALLMLIAPLWILQALEEVYPKLAVITGFVMGFLLFLSLATLGRPFEILAATAGYSAVLVVFLELGNN
ncbi:hypothetical protein F4821DRAFT_251384 [Hypoxylon rubiginosum]|uniref:Uncharacterized protein n=1 Tax=Hypoxylon rubiginosum TaxID=110542 RepID=A0ACC0CJD9_9PEZI|nr:hypothetical protein F4821DRAFT_251384 [Hypoxylon rubiginosum]